MSKSVPANSLLNPGSSRSRLNDLQQEDVRPKRIFPLRVRAGEFNRLIWSRCSPPSTARGRRPHERRVEQVFARLQSYSFRRCADKWNAPRSIPEVKSRHRSTSTEDIWILRQLAGHGDSLGATETLSALLQKRHPRQTVGCATHPLPSNSSVFSQQPSIQPPATAHFVSK